MNRGEKWTCYKGQQGLPRTATIGIAQKEERDNKMVLLLLEVKRSLTLFREENCSSIFPSTEKSIFYCSIFLVNCVLIRFLFQRKKLRHN